MLKPKIILCIIALCSLAHAVMAQCPSPPITVVTVTNNTNTTTIGSFRWALGCVNAGGSIISTVRFDIDGATEIQPTAVSSLSVSKSGATIEGANLGTGGPIIIDGGNPAGPSANGLNVLGANINVFDLTIRNFTGGGSFGLDIEAPGATIQGTSIINNRVGIFTGSTASTFTINGNTINNNTSGGILVPIAPTAGVISNNQIASNGSAGISNTSAGGTLLITNNSINCNTTSGIARAQPPFKPTITDATTQLVKGTASVGGSTIEVFIYSTAGCAGTPVQGKTYLGAVIANAVGAWTLNLSAGSVAPGDMVTATSTENGNNTSVFADPRTVVDCAAFVAGINPTPVTCPGGNNGQATAVPVNSTFQYAWEHGPTTSTVTNLVAGTYTVTITNNSGCTATQSAFITEPPPIAIGISPTQVACFGGSNGSAIATPSGGSPGYTYLWSNGQSSNAAMNLSAGTYTVTVTDILSCTATETADITQPAVLSVAMGALGDVSCFGGNNGRVTAVPSGGTPTFAYMWSNGQTMAQASNLAVGTYTVTVTDANTCTAAQTASISQPAIALSVSMGMIANVSCFGGNNGRVTATPAGGTANYSYLWNNGQTAAQATNLSVGTYTVTVTDMNACTATQTTSLNQPPQLTVNLSFVGETMAGNSDGTATATPGGGTPTYTYNWSTGATTNKITGLAPGMYQVTVTDAQGCTSTGAVTVTVGGSGGGCTVLPVYAVLAPSMVCGNTPFTLEADDLYPNIVVQYVWFLPNGDSAVTMLPSLTVLPTSSAFAGEYFVLRDSAGCRSILVGGAPVSILTVDNVSAGTDMVLCAGTQAQLSANVPSSGIGSWASLGAATIDAPNQSQTTARNLQIGKNAFVWKVAVNNCPQAGTDTVVVFLESRPVANDDHYTLQRSFDIAVMEVLLNDALAGLTDTTLIQVSTPATGQLELLADAYRFRYTVDEGFRGTVTFQYAVCNPSTVCNLPCDTATVTIDVQNLPTIPSGLVLKDNGLNGAFTIRGANGFSRLEVTITDRWGDLVFQDMDYKNSLPWLGDYRRSGNYLPGGAYYYFLRAYDGETLVGGTMTGVIHLFEK